MIRKMKQYDDYTNEMLCEAIQAGEMDAREALLQQNLSLIRKMASVLMARYHTKAFATSAFIDDLIQAGCEAILTAAESYDPARGTPFLAFAKVVIRNRLRNALIQERSKSPVHILDTEKARTVVFLDDSYDAESDSQLIESIPDPSAIMPEEYAERKKKHRELWAALAALDPRSRAFLMLRYQLGEEKRGTQTSEGILTLKESADLAHISISRAKRLESEALAFLKRHIEEHREPQPVLPAALSVEAQSAAERLLHGLRQRAAHSRLHVDSIPFMACSADHPETILGAADMTVIMREQRKSSAYVPKWVVAAEARCELGVCIRFPAAEVHVRLHIDDVMVGCRMSESEKEAPDLTEWLWFLASELWKDVKCDESVALERLHAQRCLVRDICDAVLDRRRRLGG